MIILPEQKAIVLNLRDPGRVTSVIPKSRVFEHEGNRLVAVPFGVEEARVLRNLGIKAPSPITYEYDWPRKPTIDKPFDIQIATAEFFTLNPRSFCLSEFGCGKTLSALWAADYLMRKGVVKKALIISKLSTLNTVWLDEIIENLDRTGIVLHDTRKRRLQMLEEDVDFYILNHDGIKIVMNALKTRPDINLIIVDEGASFRNANTDRWEHLNAIATPERMVWWMTGTPTPEAPTDAYGQIKIVSPSKAPKYFKRFRDAVMRQVSTYRWVPRDSANDIVRELMQPAIRFERKDIMELPPCMYETREAAFTPEQAAVFKEMFKKAKVEYAAHKITAVNEAVVIGKLLQIAAGAIYAPDKSCIHLPVTPRLNVVEEIIEEATAKVILFGATRGIVEMLAEYFATLHKTVGMVHGGVSKKDRDRIFYRFQKTDSLDLIVAQPATMSHGLTLTEANVITWYGPIFPNEVYEQANARITRPGQKNTQFIIHIEGCALEKRMYQNLKTRGNMQGVLLDMFKGLEY